MPQSFINVFELHSNTIWCTSAGGRTQDYVINCSLTFTNLEKNGFMANKGLTGSSLHAVHGTRAYTYNTGFVRV
jgi:hypothetical protein